MRRLVPLVLVLAVGCKKSEPEKKAPPAAPEDEDWTLVDRGENATWAPAGQRSSARVELVIDNGTGAPITVTLDGVAELKVPARTILHTLPGKLHFTTRTADGTVLDDLEPQLKSKKSYVYNPGAVNSYVIETQTYAQFMTMNATGPTREEIRGKTFFEVEVEFLFREFPAEVTARTDQGEVTQRRLIRADR